VRIVSMPQISLPGILGADSSLSIVYPDSLNPDPDPAFQVNSDTDSGF
jgi:hypothetical protein